MVTNDLEPQLARAKQDVERVGERTKITKQQVELITRSVGCPPVDGSVAEMPPK